MSYFYPDELIEQIRNSNDIVELVSEYVHLKRGGRSYSGLCPFHNEKTPSFSVSQEKQIFHCFGCGEGGNAVTFLMKIENISFVEAIQMLAKRSRIELPEEDVSDEIKRKNIIREKIYNVNTEAGKFFYQNLIDTKGLQAMNYLTNRGIDLKTIKKFGLGYAIDEWDALNKHLLSKGFTQDIICKAELAKQTKNGNYIDAFRNRVMFPIFDISSKLIGFGGRALGDTMPKYLNSPETVVFNKSKNLYALNIAKNSNNKKLIIAEGYMDVIALHQYGIDYAVASLGTALTDGQAKLLKKYSEEIIMAYDSDNAGQAATQRGIEVLNKIDCKIKVLQLPDGKDPDEYVRKHGIDKFINLVNNSKTHIEYQIQKLRNNNDLQVVEGKINFLNRVSDILTKIDNSMERDVYIRKLSQETDISTESIIAQVNKKIYKDDKTIKNTKNIKVEEKTNVIVDKKLDNAEKVLLYLISQYQDYYKKLSDIINIELFTCELNRKVAVIIIDKISKGQIVEPGELMTLLKEQEEIRTISDIFSISVDFEDVQKAIEECLSYIIEIKKKNKLSYLLKLRNEFLNDQKKLDELDIEINDLIKINDKRY